MTTTRSHFALRIDMWTPDGESVVEHITGVEDYQVALATFRAAVERWPGTPITLRHGGMPLRADLWVQHEQNYNGLKLRGYYLSAEEEVEFR